MLDSNLSRIIGNIDLKRHILLSFLNKDISLTNRLFDLEFSVCLAVFEEDTFKIPKLYVRY